MKVGISSDGKDLNSQIDPRFGRCAYFLIVNTEDMSFEAFENKGAALTGGAGIQAAQFVISKGAKVVITGRCGPKAAQTLSAAGIELSVNHSGTVKEVLKKYKNPDLTSKIKSQPNVSNSDKLESAQTSNSGRGMGMGAGRGSGGCGRGMGRGGGGGGGGRGMGGGNRGLGR